MPPPSDDSRRRETERFVSEEMSVLDLKALGWSDGVWVPSVDVWVNGQLVQPGSDYEASQFEVLFASPLLFGDTVRVAGNPARP